MANGPSILLKFGALVFAVLCTLWMLSLIYPLGRVNVFLLGVCGAVAGYGWYRAMRGQLGRKGPCARERDTANSCER